MKLAIIDFNRTIYDPATGSEVPGASQLLTRLRGAGYALVLVSRNEDQREELITRLGIERFFTHVRLVDEKSPALFVEIADAFAADPADTIIIGDHPREEIACGNAAGMRTIRLRRGKFAHLTSAHPADEPWHTVDELREIIPVLGI